MAASRGTGSADAVKEAMSDALAVLIEGARMGIPVENVREVVALANLTPVPSAPPIVRGVSQVRGQVLPVLDPAVRAGVGQGFGVGVAVGTGHEPRTPRLGDAIVLVELDGVRAALLVDEVIGVEPADAERAPPFDLAATFAALRRAVEAH